MEPILTGSGERACSFFSEDAGKAEACLVSLVVLSVRSEIVRVDQKDQMRMAIITPDPTRDQDTMDSIDAMTQ